MRRDKYRYASRHDHASPNRPRKSCLEAVMKTPTKHNTIETELMNDRTPHQVARISIPITISVRAVSIPSLNVALQVNSTLLLNNVVSQPANEVVWYMWKKLRN